MTPLHGNAGFRYTPAGGTTRTHRLAVPMVLDMVAAHRKRRWAADSLDLSAREVISIAPGRAEVAATLRFNRNAQDLVAMLTLAADGVVLNYYPDLGVDTSYPLWLVSPSGDAIEAAWDQARYGFGDFEIRVRFRDASASGTSLEALFSPWLFRLDGGQFPDDAVFTRSGEAWQRGQFGPLESVADGLARTEWVTVDGLRVPTTLLEPSRTNLFTRSDDLTHSDWTKGATSVVADQDIGPYGTATLEELVEDGTLAWHSVFQQVTITADAVVALSAFVMANTRDYCQLALRDAGAITTNYVRARFDLTDGSVRSTAAAGTGTFVRAYVEDWTDVAPGLYRVVLVGSVGNSATAIQGRCHMLSADGSVDSFTGDGTSSIYVGGMQIEDGAQAASTYEPSTTSTASRGSETLYAPFPHPPQPLTVYAKWVERGNNDDGAANPRVWHIGTSNASTDPRMALYRGGSGYATLFDIGGSAVFSTVSAADPEIGDVVEVSSTLSAAGAVQSHMSINGAATVTAAATSALGIPAAWAAERIYINSGGTTNRGVAAFLSVKVATGVRTLAEMRAL